MIITVCVLSMISQSSLATDCDKVLGACDAALKARKEEVRLCDLALQQSKGNSTALNQRVDELNGKLESPIRNPFIMTTVGVVIGIIVGGIALRK